MILREVDWTPIPVINLPVIIRGIREIRGCSFLASG
jgi:hypothetical protein